MKVVFVFVSAAVWSAGIGAARADDLATKVCAILEDVGQASVPAKDAEKQFLDRLAVEFDATPTVLGQLVSSGDRITADACPDARTTLLGKIRAESLTEVLAGR